MPFRQVLVNNHEWFNRLRASEFLLKGLYVYGKRDREGERDTLSTQKYIQAVIDINSEACRMNNIDVHNPPPSFITSLYTQRIWKVLFICWYLSSSLIKWLYVSKNKTQNTWHSAGPAQFFDMRPVLAEFHFSPVHCHVIFVYSFMC